MVQEIEFSAEVSIKQLDFSIELLIKSDSAQTDGDPNTFAQLLRFAQRVADHSLKWLSHVVQHDGITCSPNDFSNSKNLIVKFADQL